MGIKERQKERERGDKERDLCVQVDRKEGRMGFLGCNPEIIMNSNPQFYKMTAKDIYVCERTGAVCRDGFV